MLERGGCGSSVATEGGRVESDEDIRTRLMLEAYGATRRQMIGVMLAFRFCKSRNSTSFPISDAHFESDREMPWTGRIVERTTVLISTLVSTTLKIERGINFID